jgi:hypothetical protein
MSRRPIEHVDNACTIGGATGNATVEGLPLLFSNSDDPFNTRTRLVVVKPDEGYRFIATQIISPPPPVSFNQMHTRGLNSAGFGYTWAAVRPAKEPDDQRAIGIPYYQFGHLLLSRAASVEDAIDLLQEYPRAYHGNYLFADSHGEIALVEVSTESFNIETRTNDGYLARANHWISDAMASIGDENVAESTLHRYHIASELIERLAGRIDADSIREITANHNGRCENGYSICAHGAPPTDGTKRARGGTVSSEIIEVAQDRFWYCYGWPCGSAPDDPEDQPHQEWSWGEYVPFDLSELEPGEYVTTNGRLTPLAVRYLTGKVTKGGSVLLT